MEFRTLENTTVAEVLNVFNLSFLNSISPFQLTKDEFEQKIKNESIDFKLSAGAFIDNVLVGFILHAKDLLNNKWVAYNAGTGVEPNFRGRKIIPQLYRFILPILKNKAINKVQLEVVTENVIALSIYKNIGFEIKRELNCYKGSIYKKREQKHEIRDLKNYDWLILRSFWDVNPSWQNQITAVNNAFDKNVSIGIYDQEILLGYMIYNPISNKIQQLAVDQKHRRKGLGRHLLEHISTNNDKELLLNNADNSSKDVTSFFETLGIDIRLKQYEMSLEI
ncbi:MAG: GNAT family N-acetyltransferase [Flavobacterium sp.]